ncbi:MAG: alpha/beta hydrolase [Barnesiella intestinihominis]|jgi:hypothetical protein
MIKYMRHIFIFIVVWLAAGTICSFAQYKPDRLGEGFEAKTIVMPDDYSGKVVTTLVRSLSSCDTHKAVLYVHGYNDYFFQETLARTFNDSCFNFYAVDLRKYGRSLLPEQTPFEVRDLQEYFADIDTALTLIREEGNTDIVLMAHSTGGLITSLYCEAYRNDLPVQGLILNSPFLDMNMNWFYEKILVPIVSAWGRWFKGTKISQGNSTAYAESLLKDHHGEWDYDTGLKFKVSPPVSSAWIRAIHRGHNQIHKGLHIPCPVLLMYSSQSVDGNKWTPQHQSGDAVLDVKDIARYGRMLGPKVTEFEVQEGMHDLVLSKPSARQAAYSEMFRWLRSNGLNE